MKHLQSFLGNERVVEILQRAVAQDRLPHALIFAGPAGVGKRTLAVLLAQRLNCLSPAGEEACGVCHSCRRILAGVHPDVRIVEPEGTFIKIEQIRTLIGEIAFQPFEGRYRVIVLDGADQMRQEAANSLLKTLEEPPSRSFIILVTTSPHILLGTIRSRCRMLQFGGIPQTQIADYLVQQQGRDPDNARLAAVFSNGSLAVAMAFDTDRFQETRKQALRFVRLLLKSARFAEVSPLAATVAKDKEVFQLWIDAVAALLRDVYYARTAPGRVSQQDIAGELKTLADSVSHTTVVSAIVAIRKLKISVMQNVNRQIALEAFFLSEVSRVRP